jgi:hypothetical protein
VNYSMRMMSMTFRLPEIKVSERVYDIAKIALLVGIFVVFVIGIMSASDAADAYNFVYCLNEVTNTIITYPEGTECDVSEEIEEEEENDDSKE